MNELILKDNKNEIILKNNESEHFELITYPDGQHTIRLNFNKFNLKEEAIIACRIKNFAELEVLLCLISALQRNDIVCIHIDFIYLFGMRSDRAFDLSEPSYFRDVVAPILNSIRYGQLPCLKYFLFPHNLNVVSYVKNSARSIKADLVTHPDFGNAIRVGSDRSTPGVDIAFYKVRLLNGSVRVYLDDENLNLLKNAIEDFPNYQILIIDDLCDGGATFIAEAKYLREVLPKIRRLSLFVCHGLFTKGFNELFENFDHIYTTNSYQDFEVTNASKLTVIKVI